MSQATGPDISFYQDDPNTPQGVDFTKLSSQSNFVIIRAGQNLWVDNKFSAFWAGVKQVGLPRGSYWFYDSRADPKLQAELWIQTLGSDQGELPLFSDLEESYGGPFKGWQNWRIFLEQVKTLAPQKEIFIYTAFFYWQDNAPNATTQAADLEYFHKYPLWIANYQVTTPAVPKPWGESEWLFWQYTDRGDGKLYGVESAQIDLNYFNGTLDDFKSRFNLSAGNPPPVAQVQYRVDLSVRATPSDNGNILGHLNHADEVTRLSVSTDTQWLQISRADGLTGWVNTNAFVQIGPSVPGTGKFYRVNVASLRLRSGPGTNYDMIGGLVRNDVVEELSANSDRSWLQVRKKDGLIGWCASQYLTPISSIRPAKSVG